MDRYHEHINPATIEPKSSTYGTHNNHIAIIGASAGGVPALEKILPKINPDFIYLDAPDHKYIDGAISGIKLNQDDFMPMNSDILKIEHFLTPGAIILVDGRTSNANFLKNNFKRNWLYNRDKIRDHSIFILNDEPIGKINKKQISFYLNKS